VIFADYQGEAMRGELSVGWCNDPRRARELAEFFAAHVGTEYVSHSELQGPRALSPDQWRDNLPAILHEEIEPRLAQFEEVDPGPTSQPILVAESDGAVVGLSFVTFAGEAGVPFAIVEDLIVVPSMRGQGIGKAILDWIAAEARARGIRRLFLESGVQNERAHHFFEQEGFQTVSVVMMRSL
jgi:GNAT superfamily N-acetyltransferase